EDGIRDFHVTGVQTCALPILRGTGARFSPDEMDCCHRPLPARIQRCGATCGGHTVTAVYRINDVATRFGISKSALRRWEQHGLEIGRASGRERVESWGVGGCM